MERLWVLYHQRIPNPGSSPAAPDVQRRREWPIPSRAGTLERRHMTPTMIKLYSVHHTALPSSVVQMDSIPTRRKGRKAERPRCAVRESVAAAGASPTPIDLGNRDDSGQMVETRRVVHSGRGCDSGSPSKMVGHRTGHVSVYCVPGSKHRNGWNYLLKYQE